MDNERIRELCLALPHATETLNWGHHLVYWAGDRDIGGKMFAMTDLDGTGFGVLWFHCGAERFHELLEREGIVASPHLARAHWVAVERWDVLRPREVEDELKPGACADFRKAPQAHQGRAGHAGEGTREVDPRAEEGAGRARRWTLGRTGKDACSGRQEAQRIESGDCSRRYREIAFLRVARALSLCHPPIFLG